ncbi:MAG: DNA repair protein RecO [Candidatus Omnitrophica bacterium]|nr:DNA repair protein RecO [Candidatus Omnitrophota bacterium]
MSIHKTEAVILRTQPFRSSSLIVTFFTPQFGKVRGVVKGVHREGEVRQAGFEIFTHAEFIFYEKKRSDLHLISEAAILDSRDAVRNRLDTIAYGSYFCELTDELTEVHDPHPGIFGLLQSAFRFLAVIPPAWLALLFEIKLLREMGWLPYLEDCSVCGAKPLEQGYFSVQQGALICEKCRGAAHGAHPVTAPVLSAFRAYGRDAFEDALRAPHTAGTDDPIRFFISQFLNYRIGKVLRSKKFLESVSPVLACK